MGEEYYGNAFTCEPVHNPVHREFAGIFVSRASAARIKEFLLQR
jgi:hypothetical protein